MRRFVHGCSLRSAGVALGIALGAAIAPPAPAQPIRELVRIEGQEVSVIRGLGLVTGLAGTGDSASELAMARPLAEVLRSNGNPIPDFKDLGKTKSVALVMVRSLIPESGARSGDRFDATVTTLGSAKSLQGGVLFLSPMRGPAPGSPVYAVADGLLQIDEPNTATVGRIRGGAVMLRGIRTTDLGSTFTLILKPYFAGWSAASEIASRINQEWYGTADPEQMASIGEPIATAFDEREIRIQIPDPERANKAAFVSDVLSTTVNAQLLGLPAAVIVNERTGGIVVTADVRIGPVAITHKDLTITTTLPPPQPTQASPIVQQRRWAGVQTGAKPRETAKLQDLLAAFERLDVPPKDQIDIIYMIERAGMLHARLIRDE